MAGRREQRPDFAALSLSDGSEQSNRRLSEIG
jgi:hypothetical protein